MWRAEQFQGKIIGVKKVRAELSVVEREEGVTIYDKWPDGVTICQICGNRIWHYWVFRAADGREIIVGEECSKVVCGKTPEALRAEIQERNAQEYEREQATIQAGEFKSWWRATEQKKLRSIVLLGARKERQICSWSRFYRDALERIRKGKISDRYRLFIEKREDAAQSAIDMNVVVNMLCVLDGVRLGKFDREIIADFMSKYYRPVEMMYGGMVSQKQRALIESKTQRYRKQIEAMKGDEFLSYKTEMLERALKAA